MSNSFKVGQAVRTPDGRIGRILFFSNYAKPINGHCEPTAAVVLIERKGNIHDLAALVAVDLQPEPSAAELDISTEIPPDPFEDLCRCTCAGCAGGEHCHGDSCGEDECCLVPREDDYVEAGPGEPFALDEACADDCCVCSLTDTCQEYLWRYAGG